MAWRKKLKLGNNVLRKVLKLRQKDVVGFDKGQFFFFKEKTLISVLLFIFKYIRFCISKYSLSDNFNELILIFLN